jgi:hypothetical protein
MSVNAPTIDNPLSSAIYKLGIACRDRRLFTSSIVAGSVERMLVHIANINSSVLSSTQDHVNAAKRLNDFALTIDRIAKKSDPPNEELANLLTEVASDLRVASQELAGAKAIPNWQEKMTPAPTRDWESGSAA